MRRFVVLLCLLLVAQSAVAEEFEPFFARFRASVAKQDKTALAAMAQFPLRCYEISGLVAKAKKSREPLGAEVSRAEFLKYYSKLFTAEARRLIASSAPSKRGDMPGDVRSVMFHKTKAGYAWIDLAQDEAGAWHMLGTDNVSN